MTQTFKWQKPVGHEYFTEDHRRTGYLKRGGYSKATKRKDHVFIAEGSEEAIYELASLPTVEATDYKVPKNAKRQHTNCKTPSGRAYVITYMRGVGKQYKVEE